jgi:SMODS and SLOG-associating 2TM effector domain family 4
LEQHSQTDDTLQARRILDGQLRECYGRVVYSHKTHEKCADILLCRQSRIRMWQIVLSAVTTAGFVGAAFGAGQIGAIVGLIVSTVLLALNSYTKNYDLGELAQKHKQAANELWLIREKYLSLLVDVAMREKPLESLQDHRDTLTEQLHRVYSGAPSTNLPAYKKAQEALQKLEDMTFSDAEIDAFLPRELKRGSLAQDVLNREAERLTRTDPPQSK